MDKLSLIVPCFNEGTALPHFYEAVNTISKKAVQLDFEIIFVNDGSKDNTLDLCREYARQDERVKYISFSRNFGKEAAMYAGLKASGGNLAAFIDADLQHPPEMLLDMYHAIKEEGFDCCAARRVSRKGEPLIRSASSRIFYTFMRHISNTEIVDGATDFRMFTRQVADAILSLSEKNRFTKGIFSWIGFETKWLEYVNIERIYGETKWTAFKLMLYSISAMVDFSTKLLSFSSFMGFLFCIAAILTAAFIVIKTIIWGDPVAGFPTLICVILLVGGVQLLSLGVLGSYLSRTYMESKKRPLYIIKETQDASPLNKK